MKEKKYKTADLDGKSYPAINGLIPSEIQEGIVKKYGEKLLLSAVHQRMEQKTNAFREKDDVVLKADDLLYRVLLKYGYLKEDKPTKRETASKKVTKADVQELLDLNKELLEVLDGAALKNAQETVELLELMVETFDLI